MEGGSQEEKPRTRSEQWADIMQIHDLMDVRYKKWTEADLQEASGLPAVEVRRCIESLMELEEVVEVENPEKPGETHYANAFLFEDEVNPLFEMLRECCLEVINSQKVVSLERIAVLSRARAHRVSGICVYLPKDCIKELLIDPLILKHGVIEVTSNGTGEFASIPAGQVCYKLPAQLCAA